MPEVVRRQRLPRLRALDALRGFTIVSMVLFHAMFDYAYVYSQPAAWFTSGAFQEVWRCSISWVFIALAGWMTSFSRNNIKRAALYGACAIVVWLATSIAQVSTPVSFGILYCMAASTLLWVLLSPAVKRMPREAVVACAICCLLLFLLTYGVPRRLYEFSGLEWLGFPSHGFVSGDYYPLVPYAFLYVGSACFATLVKSYPVWMERSVCKPLALLGRHSLLVYLLHQPLLILAFELIF